jgi:nitrogenase subunit NifH
VTIIVVLRREDVVSTSCEVVGVVGVGSDSVVLLKAGGKRSLVGGGGRGVVLTEVSLKEVGAAVSVVDEVGSEGVMGVLVTSVGVLASGSAGCFTQANSITGQSKPTRLIYSS